ncbi:hypothetical protein [Numidum massiliense]|uniref:hypothetical protein n=1 Tax=Numidum massiliense TaxID=1522315 RepID=UPI0006D55602|nr:hypothetical protein [Numidum massiliense]
MRDSDVYDLVCRYAVLQNVYKSLLYDQRAVESSTLKLRRAYPFVLADAVRRVTDALGPVLEALHRERCRILSERAVGKHHYYILYRHRGQMTECQIEAHVLRAQCEDALRALYSDEGLPAR